MFQTLPFLMLIWVTALTPGPNNIASMANGSRIGFRRGLPFNFGVLAGFVCVASICAFFTTLLTRVLPQVMFVLRILGALYMLYLAYSTLNKKKGGANEAPISSGFPSGVLLQFMNPKIMILTFTVMSSYVLPVYTHPLIIFAFCCILAVNGFAMTLLWSAFGSLFQSVFEKHNRVVSIILALLLVYCAVSLFL
jgi:threonine/homoserine/homoserine lactone efflux protein